ncbi:hypothetical protein FOL47_009396, partial [Perkinsus chesapeaki]
MSFLFNLASTITSALEGDPTPVSAENARHDPSEGNNSDSAKWESTAVSKATSVAKEGADFFSALADSMDRDVSTYDVVEGIKECRNSKDATPMDLRHNAHLSESLDRLRESADKSVDSLLVNQDNGKSDEGLSNIGILLSLLNRVLAGDDDSPLRLDASNDYTDDIVGNILAVVQKLWDNLEEECDANEDSVAWPTVVSMIMSRTSDGATFIRSLEVNVNSSCKICNSIVRQSEAVGLSSARESLTEALVHSPRALGALLGAISALASEDGLQLSEQEPAPAELEFLYHMLVSVSGVSADDSDEERRTDGGDLQKIVCFQGGVESLVALARSNSTQLLVVAACAACLYQLSVNEGCRKYIMATGLLKSLVDLCYIIVSRVGAEVDYDIEGNSVLASIVSCITSFGTADIQKVSTSSELRLESFKALTRALDGEIATELPEEIRWLSQLLVHIGLDESSAPGIMRYAVEAMLTSAGSDDADGPISDMRRDMMEEVRGVPVSLSKYLCTAPGIVNSSLRDGKQSPVRAEFALRMLSVAHQEHAEVGEIYFEGRVEILSDISSLVRALADAGNDAADTPTDMNGEYQLLLLAQALRVLFLWAAGSSSTGELRRYTCDEIGNSPLLLPALTALASRQASSAGQTEIHISGLACAILGASVTSGNTLVQDTVEAKVTVKTFVSNMSALLQLKYQKSEDGILAKDGPEVWSDLQRTLDGTKKCFVQGLLSKATPSGNISEQSAEASTDSGNGGAPSVHNDDTGEEVTTGRSVSNEQLKNIVAGYQSIISAHEQELTELRKEVDRLHAENEKLKSSLEAQGMKMSEAGDCDATMALVDRVAKSLRDKIDSLTKQLADAQAQAAENRAKTHRQLLAEDNERRTRMMEALGKRDRSTAGWQYLDQILTLRALFQMLALWRVAPTSRPDGTRPTKVWSAKDSSYACPAPKELVKHLDEFIIGQYDAKRVVAIAVRDRWRRQQISDASLRKELLPTNILLEGPSGCGKTEIARRLADVIGAPLVKVVATKYTEVGFIGEDTQTMIHELADASYDMERKRVMSEVQ